MKYTPLHFGLFSFLGGVFVSDIFREYWVLNGVILFFLLFFLKKNIFSLAHLVFGILFFLLGCLRIFFALPSEDLIIPQLSLKENPVIVHGVIDSFPKQKNEKIEFFLRAESFSIAHEKNSPIDPPERILVNIFGQHSEFQYGNLVEISGNIKIPEKFGKFSYNRFLEGKGVYGYFPFAQGKIIETSPTHLSKWEQFWQKAFLFRNTFEYEIRRKLPFPESEYALGILLGAESGIPNEILEEFNDTGLRHLLALSGFNITILFLIIFWIFAFLPKKIQIFFALLSISVFVFLTGASSSVVRAALMGGIGILILHSGRNADVPLLLLFTLFGISIWNPFLLASDMSLQFSILAVLGLYFLVPWFQKKFASKQKKNQKKNYIREILFATLAAQIFTLPLAVVFFEQFSLIAPLANIVVAPLTSAAMLLSFLTTIPYFGWFFMPFAYIVLHFSLGVAHVFSLIPYAKINTSTFPLWTIIPLFLFLIAFVWWIQKKK